MQTVENLLRVKGRDVWSTTPDTPVYDALALMAEKDVGALLVIRAGQLVGIFSERDYARKVILKGKSSKEIPVREIMTEKVYFARPSQTVVECMALMTERHVRHLPVLREDELVGVVSIGDVVRSVIAEQRDTIQLLEQYITAK